MSQTLEELKAENAAAEAADAAVETPATEVEAEAAAAEEDPEEIAEPGEAEQSEAEEPEVERWMQADEQESATGGVQVPIAKHVKLRAKLQESKSEIEELRAENERLKAGSVRPEESKVMPKLEDYDFDESKFQAAVVEWSMSSVDSRLQQRDWQQQVAAAQSLQKAEVEGHYQRAEKLASERGITPDAYQQSDLAVRQAIEAVMPNMGDNITDGLIARLGEGSEKVMYHLGLNPSKQAKMQGLLRDDPTGLAASIYLGELKGLVSTQKKQVSRARKPGTRLPSGGSVSNTASELKRKYSKAKSPQERFDIASQAKALGENTKTW